MATPDWLASTEKVIGANHPIFTNTKDRPGQTINSMLDVQHDAATGTHDARAAGMVLEQDSFAGNGAARTITLTNTGLLPKKVLVWESGGTEKIVNGSFTTDTTGWTSNDPGTCVLTSVAGGVSGNCLQMEITGGAGGGSATQAPSVSVKAGRAYSLSVWVKSGTSGAVSFSVGFGGAVATGSTTGSWVQHTASFIPTIDGSFAGVLQKVGGALGTTFFDEFSVIEGGYDPVKIDTMTSDKTQPGRYSTTAWAADIVTNLQVGSFDVENGCNTSGVTNHYLVVGVDTTTVFTGDAGAGSDPDWIDSSVSNLIIADNTATVSAGNIANDVESQIWTQFIEEHTDAGAHSITIAGYRVETNTFTGNAADDRNIATALTDLDIKYLCILKDGVQVFSKSESMAGDTTKYEATAAFQANYIQSLGTGTFQIGSGANTNLSTYVYYAIGV